MRPMMRGRIQRTSQQQQTQVLTTPTQSPQNPYLAPSLNQPNTVGTQTDQIGQPGRNLDQNLIPQQPIAQGMAGLSKKARIGFIRKVYCTVASQLLLTAVCGLSAYNVPEITQFLDENKWISAVGSIVFIIGIIILGCFKSVSHRVPINYFLLILVTLGMSCSV